MPSSRLNPVRALAGAALLVTGLSACTSTAKPPISPAVLEMRHAAAERARAGGCADPRLQGPESTMVRFGFGTAELDDLALRRLQPAADYARCAPTVAIVLAGEADPQGTAQEKRDLAARRVEAMRAYLLKAGIGEGRLRVAASVKDAPSTEGGPLVLQGVGRGW